MNRRITITVLLCLIGLWSAAESAEKINPPPVAEINQKPPAQPPKLPPGTLPTELPKPPRVDSSGGNTADRLRQLEEDGLQPGPKGKKSGAGAVTRVVSDRVIKTGSRISGGWREYAADQSWRRVVFRLDGHVGTIVFSDGKPGTRLPSVTHYASSGPGPKGSPASYNEVRTFAGAPPGILDKAKTSSQIPSDVAVHIRELSGGIKLMQQLADIQRISELGSALDAARGPADDGGFFGGRPGGSPGEGNWSNPRRGVGRDGRAGDDVIVYKKEGTDEFGNSTTTTVTRHNDGGTTTTSEWRGTDGSSATTSENKDARGNVTGGTQETNGGPGGGSTSVGYSRDIHTGVEHTLATVRSPDGSSYTVGDYTDHHRTTPSETGSRGGFNEAELARRIPWLMDAYYANWKRENDLVKSGGRIKQPGRGEQSTVILNEGPEVGASGVVNCGDSNTNPCARPAGVTVDTRRSFGNISQPGRGVEPAAPTGPRPIPVPEPQ